MVKFSKSNHIYKRLLSILLVFVLFCGLLPVTALAGVSDISVQVSLTDGDNFDIPRQALTVSAGLAGSLGYTYATGVTENDVTVLDVLAAAHVLMYGTDDVNSHFIVNESGYITTVFGVATSAFGFSVNGEQPHDDVLNGSYYTGYSANQAIVHTDDIIEFYFYRDDPTCLDYYSWFEQDGVATEAITVEANKEFTLALKGYSIGWYGCATYEIQDSVTVYMVDAQVGTVDNSGNITAIPNKTADENGNVTLSFPAAGTYILTAIGEEAGDSALPVIPPRCVVTVNESAPAAPTTIDLSTVTADVNITSGGTYILTGSTELYTVTIDTTDAAEKTVHLTLDNASILLPEDYSATGAKAFFIKGGAAVNMTVKDGTTNTISNICAASTNGTDGYGIYLDSGTKLNIGGSGKLDVTASHTSLNANTGSHVAVDYAAVNISSSDSSKNQSCVSLSSGASLTVNGGILNILIPEKTVLMQSYGLNITSGASYIQNGGHVSVIDQASASSTCYGINDLGTLTLSGGTLVACGRVRGISLGNNSVMSIGDNAAFLAAGGDKGTSTSRAGIGFSTGSAIADNGGGKGAVNLKLDSSTITAATQLTLRHKTAGVYTDEISTALPMDTFCIAFSAKPGGQYCVSAGDHSYVVSSDGTLTKTVFSVEGIVAQPAKADASVISLPASFAVSAAGNATTLKDNSSIQLSVSPSFDVDWKTANPSVATVNSSGAVTAVSAGSTTITAECLEVMGTFDLTVIEQSNPRTFTLTVGDADSSVVISDGDLTYNPISVSNGVFTYQLEDGNYTYSVSKTGLQTKTGSFTVSAGGTNSITVQMSYNVNFELIAGNGVTGVGGAVITVLDITNQPIAAIDGQYKGLSGKYTYTVALDGCYTAVGSFDSNGAIRVTLNKDRSSSPSADWAGAYNHDGGNAVLTDALPMSADQIYEKWAIKVGTTDSFGAAYAGATVVADGYLYITGNGYLNKIDSDTGEIAAQTPAGTTGYQYDYLAYGDGMIFLSGSTYITAYDASTLTYLWRTAVGGQHSYMVNGNTNSKGTTGFFRPIVYSNGYIFSGKNTFKATSFEVDENGYNKPVWSISDDFNWSSGAVVGDYYYVASVHTLYAVNIKTGEITDSWQFSSGSSLYTWGGVAYSSETQRLYWTSYYEGGYLYSIKINPASGTLIKNTSTDADKPCTVSISQESVCTPIVYNNRVYVTGQLGNVDVLKAVPNEAGVLETIYVLDTPEKEKTQSTPILCTKYATPENNYTVYLYFQGYTKPAPIYVMEDSAVVTSAEQAKINILATPSKSQFAYEQIAFDNNGSIYFFNESGYLFCFDKVSSVTPEMVAAFINTLPASGQVKLTDKAQIENARTAYNSLTAEQKAAFSSAVYKKLTDAEAALAELSKPPEKPETDITVSFTLLGTAADGETGTANTLKAGNLTTWIASQSVKVEAGSSVGDVFKKVLDNNSYTYTGLSSNYIRKITTPAGLALAEFTNGKNSGWMYTVNGTHPNVGLNDYVLSDGDTIIWHYTDDYTAEEGSDHLGGNGGSGSGSESTSAKADLDTVLDKTTGTASCTLSGEALDEFNKAVASGDDINGSKATLSVTVPESAKTLKLTLPKSSVTALSNTSNTSLLVESSIGSLSIDPKAIDSISAAAGNKDISISVAKLDSSALTDTNKELVGNHPVYDLSIIADGKKVTDFGNGSVRVSLPYTPAEGESTSSLTIFYIDAEGNAKEMDGAYYDSAARCIVFVTGHFSVFAIVYDEAISYADVKPTDWFYDAVAFAVKRDLFSGTSDTTFSPNANMTRAMLVTVLYRLDGKPKYTGTSSFNDVYSSQWYTEAVNWASVNGIVSGYSGGLFGTNDSVTREQLAAMLYNYAKYKGYDLTAADALTSYTDVSGISGWAQTAMKWAVAEGLITGRTATMLEPNGNAARAEVAVILMRLIENIAK